MHECCLGPKTTQRIKHIEFVQIAPTQALAILVTTDGQVENRIIKTPSGIPPSILTEASNYLNHQLNDLTLEESIHSIKKDLSSHKRELDALAYEIIDKGLASWSKVGGSESLIVHGQSNLLKEVGNVQDIEKIKHIFSVLETKENLMHLLEASVEGQGFKSLLDLKTNYLR